MEIKYYRKLKNIERLSGTFKHRSYNLLEHQYMVAVLFRHFASKDNVPYDINVLDLVMHHDILEVETGDLIHTVKSLNDVTKDSWNKIEEEILKEHFQLGKYSDEALKSGMSTLQHKLFKACDVLDLWIFSKEEVSIGNKNKNLIDVIGRCEKLIPRDFHSINKFMADYDS